MQAFDSTMALKTERRRKLRKRPLSLVYVELPAANGGMMRDLSEEGFALRAMMPLRAGEKTHFSFSLNESTNIAGEGKILWVEEEGRVAAVRFTEVSPAVPGLIREWLLKDEQLPKREMVPDRPAAPTASTMEELHEELRGTSARPMSPEAKELIPTTAPTVASVPTTTERAAEPAIAEVVPTTPVFTQPPSSPESENVARPVSFLPAETENPLAAMKLPTAPMEAERVPAIPDAPVSAEKEEAVPAIPDISSILLQPRMVRTISEPIESPNVTPALEPLPSLEEVRHIKQGRWLDRFTLTTAIGIMLMLMLVAAAYVYHREVGAALIWLGEKIAGTIPTDESKTIIMESPAALSPQQPPAAQGVITETGPVHPNPSSQTVNQNQENATAGAGSENMPQVATTPANKSAVLPVTPLTASVAVVRGAAANQEIGQTEYLQALQILRGKNREAEMPEAVRLLWISVEKGNPGAELALADLYWRGHGVVRNCDQTRILLSAAARKGNAEAQKRLKQFEQEGCE
jgi:hypothetical protein